jgi:Fur family ferric uptake transcriptional regulator
MPKRSTRQKRAIHGVLHQALGPLSANEILDLASEVSPGISLATVYRVVREEADNGTLSVIHLDDKISRYEEADRHHHHHFLCQRCDRAFDIATPCDLVASYVPDNFEVTGHEITLYGHCLDCSAPASS